MIEDELRSSLTRDQQEASAMPGINLDTFLVALYTIVDDLYQQHAGFRVKPGMTA